MSGETNIIHYFIIATFILLFGFLAVSIYGMHSTYFNAEVVSHEFNYDEGFYSFVVFANETSPELIKIPSNGDPKRYPVGSCVIIKKSMVFGRTTGFGIQGVCP